MKDVLGIIFTFDDYDGLRELLDHRTVAAIPFCGKYRIIDFMLSNMTNSGVHEVGIILKNKYQSLMHHIGSGKDWDLARRNGGVFLLPPYSYAKQDVIGTRGTYRGNMESLAGVYHFLQKSNAEYVILSEGNIVSNINLKKVFEQHISSNADITAVCVPFGNGGETFITQDENGYVTDVLISDYRETSIPVSYEIETAGIYIIKKELLEKLILECSSKSLFRFNRDVLQRLCGILKVKTYHITDYYSRITDTCGYFRTHMELLDKRVRDSLFNKKFPINTKTSDEGPVCYSPSAHVVNSIIGDGCTIEGTVKNSVIFRGVKIKAGAVIENCIVMQYSMIGENTNLSNVVADKNVNIGSFRNISGHETYPVFISKGSTI